jgi:hypothetical protein
MKSFKYLSLVIVFCIHGRALGQDYSLSSSLGASGLQSGSTQVISFMGARYFDVSFFRIGGGARFTNWQRQSELVINPSYKLNKVSVSALNLFILTEVDIFTDLVLGFNIDAFGTSFGEEVDLIGSSVKAKPVSTNILLGGKPDRGSLNSEFYIAYKYLNFRFATGLSHQVTEYKATDDSAGKLQRFFDTGFLRIDFFL